MTKFDSLVKFLLTESKRNLQQGVRLEICPTGTKATFASGAVNYYKNPINIRGDDLDLMPANSHQKQFYNGDRPTLTLHRLDGPARQRPNGSKEYWVEGELLEPEEYYKHPLVTLYHSISHYPPDQIKQALDMLDI